MIYPDHIQKELNDMKALSGPNKDDILCQWQQEEVRIAADHIKAWSERFETPEDAELTFINTARILMYLSASTGLMFDLIVGPLGIQATEELRDKLVNALQNLNVAELPTAGTDDITLEQAIYPAGTEGFGYD